MPTAPADVRDGVLPWDRRVRVFVSSTLEELAPERSAVRSAIERLRLTPVMFELGARTHPPRELYASYLRHSDVFVGIYGERYGWVAPDSTISGLEDEYLLATGHPKLLYVKAPAPAREPRLTALVERIWTTSGVSTAPFADPAELADRVADDLAVLLTERFRAPETGQPALDPVPLPHPPTPLVGRAAELAAVTDLLRGEDARLVTLLGPGGIGKTRLALAVAEALLPALDAVCFVELAAVSDPEQVLAAVAAALRVHPAPRPTRDLLVDVVDDHRVLVVLDNLEQLVGVAPQVADLLAACPQLRILATSRTVLHLRGEHQVPLAPLRVPSAGAVSATTVAGTPAAELFAHRARQVRADFAVDEDNAADVAAVVRRLEGIPLALELAASRLALLPLPALLRSAGSGLDLASRDVDVPDRQRTLRATIAWSYGLLEERERSFARCLAVFAGGWTLAAADAVTRADGPGLPGSSEGALEALAALVEHSLVTLDPSASGEPRFRMLNTVRAFLLEHLEESGGRTPAMRRLAAYAVDLAHEAEEGLRTGSSRAWRSRLDAELDTLRAVLDWGVETDDASLTVTVTTPLIWYWWSRGLLVDMLRRAERVAALPSALSLPPDQAGVLQWCRGTMWVATGEVDRARPLLGQAVAEARERGDETVLALALFGAAIATSATEGPTDGSEGTGARILLEESAAIFARHGDHWGRALALVPLGELALLRGDPAAAEAAHAEALAAAELIDDDHMRAVVLDQLAADALVRANVAEAARMLCRSAALHLVVHDDEGIANCLDGFAALALLRGAPGSGSRWLAAADRVRRTSGVVVWPFLQPLRTQLADAIAQACATSPGHVEGAGEDGLTALARAREEVLP